jgi:hypothetical protein
MIEWIRGVGQGILTGEGTVKLTYTDLYAWMFMLGSGALFIWVSNVHHGEFIGH